jgi:hypothetical protein
VNGLAFSTSHILHKIYHIRDDIQFDFVYTQCSYNTKIVHKFLKLKLKNLIIRHEGDTVILLLIKMNIIKTLYIR